MWHETIVPEIVSPDHGCCHPLPPVWPGAPALRVEVLLGVSDRAGQALEPRRPQTCLDQREQFPFLEAHMCCELLSELPNDSERRRSLGHPESGGAELKVLAGEARCSLGMNDPQHSPVREQHLFL